MIAEENLTGVKELLILVPLTQLTLGFRKD
jgi:hypothetical protein